jgi:hypothetical protein
MQTDAVNALKELRQCCVIRKKTSPNCTYILLQAPYAATAAGHSSAEAATGTQPIRSKP